MRGVSPHVYNAGLYAGSAAVLKLFGFAVFLWVTRTLSVGDYATWGLLYALQVAIASFGLGGVVEAVIGLLRSHRTPELRSALFAAANTVFLASSTVTMIIGAFLFSVVNQTHDELASLASVLVSGGLLAFSLLQAQIIRLEERHMASLFFSFVVPLSGTIGSVVAFNLDSTVFSFFLGSGLGMAGALATAGAFRLGSWTLTSRKSACLPILRRLSPFLVVIVLGWLGGYGNNYLIKWFFDSLDVANFTFAFTLSTLMQLIASAMSQVWSPRFYRLTHDLPFEEAERRNKVFFQYQGIALGITGALLLVIYPPALKLIGGGLAHYSELTLEVFLLVLAYVVLVPYWHSQNYLLAFDKGPILMSAHIATSALGIVILLLCIWQLGPMGVYVGFLLQMLLRSIGLLFVAKKHWQVCVSWFGIIGGVSIAGCGFLFSRFWLAA